MKPSKKQTAKVQPIAPVKVEQQPICQTPAQSTVQPGNAMLKNLATGRVQKLSYKTALRLSTKYPTEFQIVP